MQLPPFLLLLLIFSAGSLCWAATQGAGVHYLEPDGVISYKPDPNRIFRPGLRTYCYRGKDKQLGRLFQTIILNFECDHDDFSQYGVCGSPEEIRAHHETEQSLFSFNFMSNSRKRVIKLDPFNQSCIGVVSREAYTVRLNLIRIDFWRILLLAAGVFVFLSAAKLSDNALFYYICGIFLGVFASFLVVVYMTSKIFPRKPMMYGVMLGGWTLGIYFAQMLFDNLRLIFVTYQVYVFWYVLVTGFISFVVCYRMGPPKNQRSKDLIKWSLQLAAIGAIFFSSAYREATTGFCIALFICYYFPRAFLTKISSLYRRQFPPKRRLLTIEEFNEQGARETIKALDELREFCSSPNCKQWNTVLKLKDPVRFASFMEGSSHLIDDEILEYETASYNVEDISDDNDDDEQQQQEETPTNARYRKFAPRSATNGRVPAAGASTSTPTTTTTMAGRILSGGRSSRSRSRQPVPTAPLRDEFELSDDED